MASEQKKNQASIWRMVKKGVRKNWNELTTIVIVQLAVRFAALAPFLLSTEMGGSYPFLLCAAAGAAVYIAGVIPLRFWAKEKTRRMFFTRNQASRSRNIYVKWLLTGLVRYLRGILWGIPFLTFLVYFTVVRSTVDAKTFEAPIHWLSMLLGGNDPSGVGNTTLALVVLAVAAALSALLFAYGWWRDEATEYLPVRSLKIKNTFRWAGKIRKEHKKRMRKNTFVNFLLSLPGAIGLLAVLGQYLSSQVNFSHGAKVALNLALRVLRSPLPTMQMLLLLGVFLVLYLPLCVLRKLRIAALMGHWLRDYPGHAHHHHKEKKPALVEKGEEEPGKDAVKPAADAEETEETEETEASPDETPVKEEAKEAPAAQAPEKEKQEEEADAPNREETQSREETPTEETPAEEARAEQKPPRDAAIKKIVALEAVERRVFTGINPARAAYPSSSRVISPEAFAPMGGQDTHEA